MFPVRAAAGNLCREAVGPDPRGVRVQPPGPPYRGIVSGQQPPSRRLWRSLRNKRACQDAGEARRRRAPWR
eukprot:1344234-Lingulodinium_polyedra.AAC.1